MSIPQGFKAKANRIALALRHQLGLRPHDPIDLSALATRLNLPLVPLRAFEAQFPDAVAQLTSRDPDAFSALLLPVANGRHIILYNDSHNIGRQSSNIGHEVSHALLAHPPTLPFDSSGCRIFDKDTEDEASCLAEYILIPNEVAWHIVSQGMPAVHACRAYRVSRTMLEYRLNVSGARIHYSRKTLRRTAIAR